MTEEENKAIEDLKEEIKSLEKAKIEFSKEPVHYTCKAKIIKRKGVVRDE